MEAPVLDEKRRAQLDKNLRAMSESGASPDDIRKYASDFKSKFTTETEAKKKYGRSISEWFRRFFTRLRRSIRAFITEWRKQ
jgi:hypothetical protein